MQIVKVGMTIKQNDDVVLILDGEMPEDCMVVFMNKASYEELKAILKEQRE